MKKTRWLEWMQTIYAPSVRKSCATDRDSVRLQVRARPSSSQASCQDRPLHGDVIFVYIRILPYVLKG